MEENFLLENTFTWNNFSPIRFQFNDDFPQRWYRKRGEKKKNTENYYDFQRYIQ